MAASKSAAKPAAHKPAAKTASKPASKQEAPKTSPDAKQRPIDPAAPKREPVGKQDSDSTGSATTQAPNVPSSQPVFPKQVVFEGEEPKQIDVDKALGRVLDELPSFDKDNLFVLQKAVDRELVTR
jgi:hypothetical protein